MDVGAHHVANGLVYETVPTYDRQAAESFRNHGDSEMSAAIRRARVAGVAVAVVDDLQVDRGERSPQPGIETVESRGGHGNTLTKGRTSQDSKTPSVA